MKKLVFVAISLAVSGCVTVNAQEVKDMPSGFLCDLLNGNAYVSTAAERKVIYAELKERNEDCM